MQPRPSQRPQKRHPNTSRNEDKPLSSSSKEELQRAWQNLGLQEGHTLLSTTPPVPESSSWTISAVHGVGCHKQPVTTCLQGWPSSAFTYPWVLAALARWETAQSQVRLPHHAQCPGVLLTWALPWELFPAAQLVPAQLPRVQFERFAGTATCQGPAQSPRSSQLCRLPGLDQDSVEHAHLTLLVLELPCSLRRALAPV